MVGMDIAVFNDIFLTDRKNEAISGGSGKSETTVVYFRIFGKKLQQSDPRQKIGKKTGKVVNMLTFTPESLKYCYTLEGKNITVEHDNRFIIGKVDKVFLNISGFERTESQGWVDGDNLYWAKGTISSEYVGKFIGSSADIQIEQEEESFVNQVSEFIVHKFSLPSITLTNTPRIDDCNVVITNSIKAVNSEELEENKNILENNENNLKKNLTNKNSSSYFCENNIKMAENQENDNKVEKKEEEKDEVKNSLEALNNSIKTINEQIHNFKESLPDMVSSIVENSINAKEENKIKNSIMSAFKSFTEPVIIQNSAVQKQQEVDMMSLLSNFKNEVITQINSQAEKTLSTQKELIQNSIADAVLQTWDTKNLVQKQEPLKKGEPIGYVPSITIKNN